MIRYASLQDLPRIIELAKAANLFNYGRSIYSALIENHCMFVLEHKQQVVGYVVGFCLSFGLAFCLQIAVSEEYRSQGIGAKLMFHIEGHMRSLGVKTLFAHTTKERSFQYFINKLGYLLQWQCGWFRIIRKNLHPLKPGSDASEEL